MPWNIAFENDEIFYPKVFDPLVDGTFLVDILINFNTAIHIYKDEQMTVVSDRRKIARRYIRGWFFVDLFSALPLDAIFNSGANNVFKILRMSKLQKLFKLMKIPRFLKIFSL